MIVCLVKYHTRGIYRPRLRETNDDNFLSTSLGKTISPIDPIREYKDFLFFFFFLFSSLNSINPTSSQFFFKYRLFDYTFSIVNVNVSYFSAILRFCCCCYWLVGWLLFTRFQENGILYCSFLFVSSQFSFSIICFYPSSFRREITFRLGARLRNHPKDSPSISLSFSKRRRGPPRLSVNT